MTGYYLMSRGWLDNPALGGKREPYCKRAAWAWLIEEAQWQDRRASIAGKTVILRRGQLSHSTRFMAKAWSWSEAAVRRFIERLKTDAMIDASTDAGQTIITLCNYDRYQLRRGVYDAVCDAPSDAEVTQNRRSSDANKNQGNQRKEANKDSPLYPPSAIEPEPAACAEAEREEQDGMMQDTLFGQPTEQASPSGRQAIAASPKPSGTDTAEIDAAFEALWLVYDRKTGKLPARKAYERALRKTSAGTIHESARRFIAQQKSRGSHPTYTPHLATWLNQARYDDELPGDASAQPQRSGGVSLSQLARRLGEQISDPLDLSEPDAAPSYAAYPDGPFIDADFEVLR
jgi:hypothetical protein